MLLNAKIQAEDTTHSSIIDARGALALFHYLVADANVQAESLAL